MRKRNTSGRIKLKTKYTNIHKNKQRKIKLKRDKKKNPNKYHKKKADPGIPNSCPFKLEILQQRDRQVAQKASEKQKRRDEVLKKRKEMREAKIGEKRKLTDILNLETPEEDIEENQDVKFSNEEIEDFYPEAEDEEDMNVDLTEEEKASRLMAEKIAKKSRKEYLRFKKKLLYGCKNNPEADDPDYRWRNWTDKVYYKQVKEVISKAHVILQVIDARDPLGTRCPVLENIVREMQVKTNKRLVLVLNKADLIPKSNLQAWLNYLRNDAPTVPFKAAVHRPKKLSHYRAKWRHLGEETMRSSSAMGADVLMHLLKNYARSATEEEFTVGVVGLPNVGKSSLINSLKRVKSCDVAPLPGCTKSIKRVKLDKNLFMMDCPGVVLPAKNMNSVEAVLKNVVKLETINNAEECAMEIFRRSDSTKLALFYGIRSTEDGEQFLNYLAKKCNKVNKGGIYDKVVAAKKVIYDWNHGVLKYYTEPPKSAGKETIKCSLSEALEFDQNLTSEEEKLLIKAQEEEFFANIDEINLKMRETLKIQPSKAIEVGDIENLLDEEEIKVGGGDEEEEEISSEDEDMENE